MEYYGMEEVEEYFHSFQWIGATKAVTVVQIFYALSASEIVLEGLLILNERRRKIKVVFRRVKQAACCYELIYYFDVNYCSVVSFVCIFGRFLGKE